MSAECKINSKTVKWTLDPKFVKDIKQYISTGKTEEEEGYISPTLKHEHITMFPPIPDVEDVPLHE